MPKDMRRHQQIGNLRVGVEQKGQPGITVEHDLVDFRQPHGAVEVLTLIDFAIGPVARPRGQAIGGNFGHDILRHHFKGHRKKIQTLLRAPGLRVQPHVLQTWAVSRGCRKVCST